MSFSIRPFRIASLVLPLLAAAGLHATDTIYMQIPSIKGESTSKTHGGWINVSTISGCISSSTGKASACEISLSKDVDVSSNPVYLNLLSGKGTGTGKVLIDICGIGGTGTEVCYYKLVMRNVHYTSSSGGTNNGANRANESWTMSFDAISWTYVPTWYSTPGTPVTQCWDFTANDTTCP